MATGDCSSPPAPQGEAEIPTRSVKKQKHTVQNGETEMVAEEVQVELEGSLQPGVPVSFWAAKLFPNDVPHTTDAGCSPFVYGG